MGFGHGDIVQGEKAPDFSLQDASGKEVRLSHYLGRNVVLFFYPKDDSPTCTREACAFSNVWQDIESSGAVVIGISPDDVISHRQFSEKFNLPFMLLSDSDQQVVKMYGVWGKRRKWYGRSVRGVLRSTFLVNKEGVVARRWSTIEDVDTHPVEVLTTLQKIDEDS